MSVYKKLQSCRVALQQSQMKKSGHNKFAGYDYFELGDFLLPINKLFNDAGLCSAVSFTAELATLRIIDVDDGKEIVFTSPMADANLKGCHPIQNLGAVETYQRRYLYMAALEIVEHDALDSSAPLTTEKPKQANKSVAAATLEAMGEESSAYLKDLAMTVLGHLPDEFAMYKAYKTAKASLDTDEQVAWWAFFDSKSRAMIKRQKDAESLSA